MTKFFALIGTRFCFVAICASLREAARQEPHRMTITEDDQVERVLGFRFGGKDYRLTGPAHDLDELLRRAIGSCFLFWGYRTALLQAAAEQPEKIVVTDDQYATGRICSVSFMVEGKSFTLMDDVKDGIICG